MNLQNNTYTVYKTCIGIYICVCCLSAFCSLSNLNFVWKKFLKFSESFITQLISKKIDRKLIAASILLVSNLFF